MATVEAQFHRWPARPGNDAILAHVRRFVGALSDGRIDAAFALCPLSHGWRLDTPTSDAKLFVRELPDRLFAYADPLNVDDPRDLDEVARLRFLSSLGIPTKAAEVALVVPSDELGGEVIANIIVDGEACSISARFELMPIEGGWALAFGELDML